MCSLQGQTYWPFVYWINRPICDSFTEVQREVGVLVSPKDTGVIASAEDKEPTFYVVTLRRGCTHPRPREQLLQNYKA